MPKKPNMQMRAFALLGILFALALGAPAMAVEVNVLEQLAPTGKLRVGVAYAPVLSPTFVFKDASGAVHGVPRALGEALAAELGVPVELFVAPTTAEVAEACATGAIDIGFMPANDERRQRIDFSPPYFFIESTYLATGPSHIMTFADVDRPEVTVVGIAGSTTMQAASHSLKTAKVVSAKSVDEAVEMMKAGTAQAFALTHDALPALQKQLPDSRILDGAYQRAGVAIAVHKHRPVALAYVTEFIEKAKADGSLRRVFDAAGLGQQPVAP